MGEQNERPRVLVVEDELIIARNIERYLERLGYDITGLCASSEEALKSVDEEAPDLVLMDIHIEGAMDGVILAGMLKERHQIPVVYLTALMDEETLDRAKITEPFGYVVKPFSQRELHIALEIALYKSRLERRIQDQEVLLQGIIDTMRQGFCLLDTSGRLVYANRELLALMGKAELGPEEFLDQWLDPPHILQDRVEALHTGPFSLRFRRSDGSLVPGIMTAQAFKDSRGRLKGVFASLTPLADDGSAAGERP